MKRIKLDFIKDVLTGNESPLLELRVTQKEVCYIDSCVSDNEVHYVSLKEVARNSNNGILVDALKNLNVDVKE